MQSRAGCMELALATAAENDGSRSICATNDADANAARCLRLIGIGALLPRLVGRKAISDGKCTIRQIRRERVAYHSIVRRELLILAVKMLSGHFVLLIFLISAAITSGVRSVIKSFIRLSALSVTLFTEYGARSMRVTTRRNLSFREGSW
ncbi:MAG TPA: hypothetical protein VN456_06895, partial [Desulfosporosinus sp.]|nr:hypothetical protein [Desulfosporosinus sp.]